MLYVSSAFLLTRSLYISIANKLDSGAIAKAAIEAAGTTNSFFLSLSFNE